MDLSHVSVTLDDTTSKARIRSNFFLKSHGTYGFLTAMGKLFHSAYPSHCQDYTLSMSFSNLHFHGIRIISSIYNTPILPS